MDTTIICTVTDNTKKKSGEYWVTDGAAKFIAKTDDHSRYYNVGDTVRVLAIKGDLGNCYISGKYSQNTDSDPLTYISPTETTVSMTDNLIPERIDAWGITANSSEKEQIIWGINLTDNDFKDVQVNSIYNTLILKADFKCLLANYRMKCGNYGLRLRLEFQSTSDNTQSIYRWVSLDSDDMFGNPFSFLIYSTQEATFDISGLGTIKGIGLYLYQDGNFEQYNQDGSNSLIPEVDFSNILVKNIYLSFGSDLTKVEDNTLQIFTGDSTIYNGSENSSNSREIGLLWYNKNEDNTYIGFSDGIYDPDYDEITYLEDTEQDSRLVSQLGKDVPTDENGLTISADLEEVLPLLKTLRDSITRDLNSNIRSFYDQVLSIAQATSLGSNFTDVLNLINSTGKSITDNREILKEEYTAFLSEAKKKQDGSPYLKPTQTITYSKFESAVNNLIHFVDALMNNAKTLIKSDYTGYMSVYDTYESRINRCKETIDKYLKQIQMLISDDTSILNNFFNSDYEFIPYVKEDLSAYANKYCIYWYRQQANYYDAEERFMEKGWRRLTEKNLGIPREKLSEDSIYNAKKSLSDNVFITELDTQIEEEKFMAVLFYNHAMYKSNIITFTNANPPVDEKTADLAGGACYIEHGTNSLPSYQLYGLNNLILNVADVSYKRNLLCRYEGLNAGDEKLYGAQIFWYVPTNTTMLSYDVKDFTADWSNDGGTYDPDNPNSRKGYICFYRTIGGTDIKDENGEHLRYEINDEDRYFTYRIKDYYSQSFTRNSIECKVILADDPTPLEATISFVFSSFGTSGTDYTLVVSPRTTKPAADYTAENGVNLPLGVALYDYNNERLKIYDTASQVGAEEFVPSLVGSGLKWLGPTAYNAVSVYQDGEERFGVEDINITIRGDNGPKDGFYPGILEVNVPYMVDELNKIIDLITIYPIPYKAGNYYIEGANVVVYQSDGTNPSYYKNPFKIFNMETNDQITDVEWSIVCYDEDGKLINWGSKQDPVLEGFMPKLDSQNRLVPCHIYLEDNADGNNREAYPVVLCTKKGGDVLWAQPIYCMKNRYASAMMNKWDGSFQIDEENGTILSTMLGAGRKNSKNQFEGILMGDVGSASEDNASGVGLYGFHNGAQSFNFNIDGTAFIGKSGRGRIKFNGDTGSITSASYEETEESAGMKIDLDDGYIDIRGVNQGEDGKYSKYESSGIRIDVKSPYMTVRSEKGTELVHIGHEKYELQSDQYIETEFTLNEVESNGLKTPSTDEAGTGMKLDLKEGTLDAFNFYLISKNVMLNSKDSQKPYFVIKDDYNNMLMHIGNSKFWLKSADYSETAAGEPEAGMKIDLSTGKIDAFNFSLVSSRVKLSTSGTAAKPYLEIVGNDITLMHISEEGQYIRSNTFIREATGTPGAGMEINLGTGEFTAYTFNLKAGNATTGQLRIDSSASEYPLWIGTIDKTYDPENDKIEDIVPNFKVDWAGNFYSQGGKFTGAIHATSGTLGSLTVTGVLDGGTIDGATIQGGVLKVGPTVGETGYQLYADDKEVIIQNAKIINCKIESGDGASNGTGGFSVTPAGIMKGFGCSLTNGSFTTCTVINALYIGGTDTEGKSVSGNIYLNGNNKLYFGEGTGNYLYFANDGRLSVSAATPFYANTINCSKITVYNLIGGSESAGAGEEYSYNLPVNFPSGLKTTKGYIQVYNGSQLLFSSGGDSGTGLYAPSVWVGGTNTSTIYIAKEPLIGLASSAVSLTTFIKNNILDKSGSEYATQAWVNSQGFSKSSFPGGLTDTITYMNPNGKSYVASFTNGLLKSIT